jgi:hypothetical protein
MNSATGCETVSLRSREGMHSKKEKVWEVERCCLTVNRETSGIQTAHCLKMGSLKKLREDAGCEKFNTGSSEEMPVEEGLV